MNGWYCNGEEWRFNSDVVLNDMTLKAEWTAKQYTITLTNTNATTNGSTSARFNNVFEENSDVADFSQAESSSR